MEEWNLNDLLSGKTIEELTQEIISEVEDFTKYREELANITPKRLQELLIIKEKLNIKTGRLGNYFHLKFSENSEDQEILGLMTKFEQLGNDLGNKTLFFSHWFITLDDEKASTFLEAPELQDYRYYLQSLRKDKPFIRSEEVEKVINIKDITSTSGSHFYDVFTGSFIFEMDGKELTLEEISILAMSKDKNIRERSIQIRLRKYKEESTLLSEFYKNVVLDWYNEGLKIRHHKTSLGIRNHVNDISEKAVHALINTIRKNISIFPEYFALKHKINGETYPHSRYHIYAPYEKSEEKEYSYEESKELVLSTYKAFDETWYKHAKTIFDSQHVHSHPKKGKRGGAFCSGPDNKVVPYVLLNFTGKLRDVETMMHEIGHCIHDLLMSKQNNYHFGTAIPMAETASIFGEMILKERMIKEAETKEEKIALLLTQLDGIWGSVPRQAYFNLFEEYAHEHISQGATLEDLNKKWIELISEQFGDMEIPEEYNYEWLYVPHFFHSPFYCYAYPWGNLMVLALYQKYKEDPAFKLKITELLTAGGSDSPAKLLEKIGINPESEEFWQKGFDAIRKEVEELKNLSSKD